MTRKLDVYLNNDSVGTLEQNRSGQMLFTYGSDWLNDARAIAVSASLPLRSEPFLQRECRHFFSGLLPEGPTRITLAKNLGISAGNDFSMLERIGGDCAGALTFLPHGKLLSDFRGKYRKLTDQELAEALKRLPIQPLLAGEKGLRLSLAGAQNKIAVFFDDDGQISLPLNNAPSNYILKPAADEYPEIVSNECFCLNLANLVGINAAKCKLGHAGDIEYLLIERYDRKEMDGSKFPIRQHQEDFCQALGISPEIKYQSDGGPGLKDCFDLIRNVSNRPGIDLLALLDLVIFNVVIGNHDAHGKNFSILYGQHGGDQSVRLASAYDILSTVYYPYLTTRMAMRVGKADESESIRIKNIDQLAKQIGMNAGAVRKRFVEIAEAAKTKLPVLRDEFLKINDLVSLIDKRADRIIHIARGGSVGRI